MDIFPHTRFKRISVRLKELGLGQAIGLCKLPAERHELNTTELLRFIAADADAPTAAFVTDPLLWTVEERALLVGMYLTNVADDGPDFSCGGTGTFTRFVDLTLDLPCLETDMGEVAGKRCVMRPLLGVHVQSLETICGDRGDWIIGAIACTIFMRDEPAVDWLSMNDIQMREWIAARMQRLKALPESKFAEIYKAYYEGLDTLHHFFYYDFDDDGVILQPREKEGVEPCAPTRFHVPDCCSPIARAFAKSARRPRG